MSLLGLSVISVLLVGLSGNFIDWIGKHKLFLYITIILSVYSLIYGLYLLFSPTNLFEERAAIYFSRNPEQETLPTVFYILNIYHYILIIIGAMGLIGYSKFLKKKQWKNF